MGWTTVMGTHVNNEYRSHFGSSRRKRGAAMAAIDAMSAVLAERLVDVRPNLTVQEILGDGNCQYRPMGWTNVMQ